MIDPKILDLIKEPEEGKKEIRPVGKVSLYGEQPTTDWWDWKFDDFLKLDAFAVLFVEPPDMTLQILLERTATVKEDGVLRLRTFIFPTFHSWEKGNRTKVGGENGGNWLMQWTPNEVCQTNALFLQAREFSADEQAKIKAQYRQMPREDVPGIVERYLKNLVAPKKELAAGMIGTPADFDAMMKKKQAALFKGIV